MNTYIKDAYYGCILIITEGNKWFFYKNLKRKPREIMIIDNISTEIANAQVEYCKKNKIQFINNEDEKLLLKEWIKLDDIAFVHECNIANLPSAEMDKIDAGNKGKQHWSELEKKQPTKAIVKYHNYMNEIIFDKFKEIDYDVFMTLLSFIKDRGTEAIILNFKQIKDVMDCNITSKQKFIEILDNMYKKLSTVKCRIEKNGKIIWFTVFPTYIIDPDNQTLTIQVHEQFKYIFNELSNCFTIFEISEFVRLSGKYNKILYMHLKQYKNGEGWWYISSENFRKIMDIPETYTNRDIASKVLKPSIGVLSPYFKNLKFETDYEQKQGKPIKGYKFTFTPENRIMGQARFVDNESLNDYARLNINIQDEKTVIKRTKQVNSKNNFNNYAQNEYDYDLLEATILSN